MSKYDVPIGVYTIGLGMIGPTIMSHGTTEQGERFIPKMIEGGMTLVGKIARLGGLRVPPA